MTNAISGGDMDKVAELAIAANVANDRIMSALGVTKPEAPKEIRVEDDTQKISGVYDGSEAERVAADSVGMLAQAMSDRFDLREALRDLIIALRPYNVAVLEAGTPDQGQAYMRAYAAARAALHKTAPAHVKMAVDITMGRLSSKDPNLKGEEGKS
jgi:hypothetical protein